MEETEHDLLLLVKLPFRLSRDFHDAIVPFFSLSYDHRIWSELIHMSLSNNGLPESWTIRLVSWLHTSQRLSLVFLGLEPCALYDTLHANLLDYIHVLPDPPIDGAR